MKLSKIFSLIFISLTMITCVGIPDNVRPVANVEIEKYLGTWYEIARLDHSFESGLSQVSATYSLREDGGISVINKGYNAEDDEWNEAEGKAFFVDDTTVGLLKVSFFGPFYGGYNIIALDKIKYSYSMVCGPDLSYLWILSREKEMEKPLLDSLILIAKNYQFPVDELIFVDQNK